MSRSKVGSVFCVPLASDMTWAVGLVRVDTRDAICLAYYLNERFPERPTLDDVRARDFANGRAFRQWSSCVNRKWPKIGKLDARALVPIAQTRFITKTRYHDGRLLYQIYHLSYEEGDGPEDIVSVEAFEEFPDCAKDLPDYSISWEGRFKEKLDSQIGSDLPPFS